MSVTWRRRLGLGIGAVALAAAGSVAGWVANDIHNRDDTPDGFSEAQYVRLVDACVAAWPERKAACMTAIDTAESEGHTYEEVRDAIADLMDD